MAMKASQNKQIKHPPPHIYTYILKALPDEKVPPHCRPPLVPAPQHSLLPFPRFFLWRPLRPSDRSFGSSSNFLISVARGQAPERAPRFYAVFVFFVYPRRGPSATATVRAPGDTNMWAAAEQRNMFTFRPELQLDLQQKQKYCNVYFSQKW